MAKKLTMFSLRLMLLNFISIIVTLLLSMWNNTIYQWVVTALVTFLLWIFVWMDAVNIGQKDTQKDKIAKRKKVEGGVAPEGKEEPAYHKWFGFAAGLLAQVPALIALIAACFMNNQSVPYNIILPILRAWYFTYSQIMVTFEGAIPYLLFLFPVLFALVAGLGYINGPAQQKRMETIIERNKARKAKRVQDDAKNKKKGPQKKPAYRR